MVMPNFWDDKDRKLISKGTSEKQLYKSPNCSFQKYPLRVLNVANLSGNHLLFSHIQSIHYYGIPMILYQIVSPDSKGER